WTVARSPAVTEARAVRSRAAHPTPAATPSRTMRTTASRKSGTTVPADKRMILLVVSAGDAPDRNRPTRGEASSPVRRPAHQCELDDQEHQVAGGRAERAGPHDSEAEQRHVRHPGNILQREQDGHVRAGPRVSQVRGRRTGRGRAVDKLPMMPIP